MWAPQLAAVRGFGVRGIFGGRFWRLAAYPHCWVCANTPGRGVASPAPPLRLHQPFSRSGGFFPLLISPLLWRALQAALLREASAVRTERDPRHEGMPILFSDAKSLFAPRPLIFNDFYYNNKRNAHHNGQISYCSLPPSITMWAVRRAGIDCQRSRQCFYGPCHAVSR